jgi:predicted nucleic acid-binding Zn ribbon protein
VLNAPQFRHCAICNKEMNDGNRKYWETLELQFAYVFVCSERCRHKFNEGLKHKPLKVHKFGIREKDLDQKSAELKKFHKNMTKLNDKLLNTTNIKDIGVLEVID